MADWYPKKTLGSLPDSIAQKFGPREALVFEGERYTFDELAEKIDQTAKGFIALGIEPGDHVAIWLMNRSEWVFILFALAKIGAVQVPVNTRFRTNDLAYLLKQSDSKYLIAHDTSGPIDFFAMINEVLAMPAEGTVIDDPKYLEICQVVIFGEGTPQGTVNWNDVMTAGDSINDEALQKRADAVDADDPVFMMYTSGTTGFPKGVVHNHVMIRLVEERAFRLSINENDTLLNYLPLFHLFAYSEGAMVCMLTGARQVLTETFDPDECIKLVERERVSIMNGFETHLKDLTEAHERNQGDVSSLRIGLFACGMRSSVPICRKAAEVLAPLHSISLYGMSEIGPAITVGALDDSLEQRAESSGYPVPGYEIKVIDPETGTERPVGELGEIVVRGYCLMMSYYKKPEETAACYDENGWFHTGDTGVRRADGYIRFVGRYKDMLKVGGENVDPMEVEALLLQVPGIAQVAVVSYPDQRLTEVPVAFVLRTGEHDVAEDAIIDYCRGKVATFKIPRHVLFIDELPMTATGKIRKVELRKSALEQITEKEN